MPQKMFKNNVSIGEENLPDEFAEFFKSKVQNIIREQTVNNNVFNGTQNVFSTEFDFMKESDVLKAMNTLKIKNCEGHDRIPLRILADGKQFLLKPLANLFYKIYQTKQIPEQWFISKIIPIHKRAQRKRSKITAPSLTYVHVQKYLRKLFSRESVT